MKAKINATESKMGNCIIIIKEELKTDKQCVPKVALPRRKE
jgi:hypothetical protein